MDQHYISRKVIVAKPSDLLVDSAKDMSLLNISALAVVDEKGRMIGILTERDITRAAADGNLNSTVADYMTKDVIGIDASADLQDAARLMIDKGIRHLPVTDKGKVVGIISIRDIAKAIIQI
ncbi:CBS domain-containing protein [Sulfuracidifex tepidarius]|uniref:Inosine-5'-monophosphate dehydrogenase n=1 Tax=Sulfuracidifex tepidarius TaxID=1294262 RepID=A0A510DZ06_9CREN|nr:CBS domain-containing protein [Sulfuracidifex tepidarius]BBG25476.1 Inosine-5'-monophosphate dehydrogenase [Sulfuracidifex tepidarius]BBG28270.1 Inosine-5'-monophosphate dehydrogenase [Sulfuracidifex tepidarius]